LINLPVSLFLGIIGLCEWQVFLDISKNYIFNICYLDRQTTNRIFLIDSYLDTPLKGTK